MYKGQKSDCKFFMPGSDSSKLFQPMEETFYITTFFILPPATFPFVRLVGFQRDAVGSANFFNCSAEMLCLIGFVVHHNRSSFKRNGSKHGLHHINDGNLYAGDFQREADFQGRIRQCMSLIRHLFSLYRNIIP